MIWTIALRVTFTFGVLLLLTRIAGKKELSQTTFFDFVTAIAVGDIAAEKMSDPEQPLLPWTGAAVLWFALIIALDLLVVGNRKAAKLIEGEPTMLIENGRILENNLKTNYLSVDELMANLRKKGHFNPAEVEYAIFETDGTVTVQPKSQHRALTPKDLHLPTSYEGISREVVVDGQILHRNLMEMHLDAAWLRAELLKQGYPSEKQVFWASLDTIGKLYVDGYADSITGRRIEIPDYGPH
jgi:uncharacterized membrane protein YcaP (DUF421 family)